MTYYVKTWIMICNQNMDPDPEGHRKWIHYGFETLRVLQILGTIGQTMPMVQLDVFFIN